MRTVAQRNEALMRGEHAAMGSRVERLKTELAAAREAAETIFSRNEELERHCEAYASAGLLDRQATVGGLLDENRHLTMTIGRPFSLDHGNTPRDAQQMTEMDAPRDEDQTLKAAGTEKGQTIARASAMHIDQAERIRSSAHAREAVLLGGSRPQNATSASPRTRYADEFYAAKRKDDDLHRQSEELADVDTVDGTLGSADPCVEDEARSGTVPRPGRPEFQDVSRAVLTANTDQPSAASDRQRLKDELDGVKAELRHARLALLSSQRQPDSAEARLQQEVAARQALEEKPNFLTAELAARDRRTAELFAGQMASRVEIEHLKNHLCAATFRGDRLGKAGGTADTAGSPRGEAVMVEPQQQTKDLGWYPEWTNHGEGDVVVLSGDQQCERTPTRDNRGDLFVDSRYTTVDKEPLHSAHSLSQSPTASQSYPSLDNPDDTDITKHPVEADVKMPSSAESIATALNNGDSSASGVSDPFDSAYRSIR
jgi:hypothetical protein